MADDSNRLGLNYRQPLPRRISTPIVDVHTHVLNEGTAELFFEAADTYGIDTVFSMSPLEHVDALAERYGRRLRFIAVPRWGKFAMTDEFRARWLDDLGAFRERGAALCKFWVAPPMRQKHGLTLDHEFLRPVIDRACELGMSFMTHVGDPSVWWREGGKYAADPAFGTKAQQYEQLEWFLEAVHPRLVIGAHLGGSIEEPDFLQGLLDRHANYVIDTSATKWVVREVSRRPEAARDFALRNARRMLFGSDLVVNAKFTTFDHYASRYWAQQHLWESDYRGESPIADPDAEGAPQLAGLNLPEGVLADLYRGNAERLGLLSRSA